MAVREVVFVEGKSLGLQDNLFFMLGSLLALDPGKGGSPLIQPRPNPRFAVSLSPVELFHLDFP
jgi:hypothetical protein